MAEAVIADTKPVVVELEAGDYFWCTCGQSTNHACHPRHPLAITGRGGLDDGGLRRAGGV